MKNSFIHTAIIFSSSIILNKKNGIKINNFDNVIRFNRAPTETFEDFVGTKTTLRVLNEHVFKNQKYYDKSWKYINYNFIKDLKETNIMVVSKNKINDSHNYEINNNSYVYLHQNIYFLIRCLRKFILHPEIIFFILKIIFQKKLFSVGLTYLLFSLLNKKNKITLFGFDQFENMKYRSHYFEVAGKVGIYHNLNLEHQLIKHLIDLNYIKVYD